MEIKAPSPDSIFGAGNLVDEDLKFDSFFRAVNDLVIQKKFEPCLSVGGPWDRTNEYVVNVYLLHAPDAILARICEKYKEAGWSARFGRAYCGHGPFEAIYLKNPNTTKLVEENV